MHSPRTQLPAAVVRHLPASLLRPGTTRTQVGAYLQSCARDASCRAAAYRGCARGGCRPCAELAAQSTRGASRYRRAARLLG